MLGKLFTKSQPLERDPERTLASLKSVTSGLRADHLRAVADTATADQIERSRPYEERIFGREVPLFLEQDLTKLRQEFSTLRAYWWQGYPDPGSQEARELEISSRNHDLPSPATHPTRHHAALCAIRQFAAEVAAEGHTVTTTFYPVDAESDGQIFGWRIQIQERSQGL